MKIFHQIILLFLYTTLFEAVAIKTEYYPDERNALILLRNTLNSSLYLHRNWTGPVCKENQSRWFGIVCLDWHVSEIALEGLELTGSLASTFSQNLTFLTKLSFRNNSLYGPLPSLTNLSRLEILLLSRNSFLGEIPFSYTELPLLMKLELQENLLHGEIPAFGQRDLVDFNVSHNRLNGLIPETLGRLPESSFDSNNNLCGKPVDLACASSPGPLPSSPASPAHSQVGPLKIWMIMLIVSGAVIFLILVLVIVLCCYKRVYVKRKENDNPGRGISDLSDITDKKYHWSVSTEGTERDMGLEFSDSNSQMFDLDELLRSSAELIGRGNLGPTYKAVLDSGPVVAVKRLILVEPSGKKEFLQQMQFLGTLKHENLVEIISYYYAEDKLIVYEYIPDGSLFELLHENRGIGRVPLNWKRRLSIIKDIAEGLDFLHRFSSSQNIPHGNLKSSNILIQDHQSKLTCYGFPPLMASRETYDILAIARAPEFSQYKKLTEKADIYCFGIVLLEIITGKNPGIENGEDDLSDWVKKVVDNDWSTDIIDAEILAEKQGYDDEILKLTEMALECTELIPEKRPRMSEILRRIYEIEFEEKTKVEEFEEISDFLF